MELVKSFEDIRVGDTVRNHLRAPHSRVHEIQRLVRNGANIVRLRLGPSIHSWIWGLEDTPIILVRRPRPEGKTEEDMLDAVDVALRRCAHANIENDGRSIGAYVELTPYTAGREEALRSLREAIEAYELGRPEVKS